MSVKSLVPEYFRESIQPRLPELLRMSKGRPFILISKPGVLKSGGNLNRAFRKIAHQNYFAVKAMSNPWIMEFLSKELGFGADCSSPSELVLSRTVGVRGMNIMYSSNRTTASQFALAGQDGGCIVNFDDITALDRVPAPFPDVVCFRINPGKRRTGNSIIGNPYDAKYGITYEQIIPAYREALRRGATQFGIHMMVCSNELHNKYFVETVRAILEVAAMLKRELGIEVKFVNIGGGFGIPYRPADRELNLEWIGQMTTRLFRDFAAQHGFLPALLTECGRYVTGQHGFLVNPVVSIDQKYRHFTGVEAAMLGCPRPAFYGAYHHIEVYSPEGKLRTGPRHFTNVAGPLCEDWDRLTAKGEPRLLPWSIRIGDILVTFNCGGHSDVMAGHYNGWLFLMQLLDQDGTNKNTIMIRREETMADLFRPIARSPNFILPGQE